MSAVTDAMVGAANTAIAERRGMRAALEAAMAVSWQPIETAPKDGTRILIWRGHVAFGWWTNEKHHKKPQPHWSGSDVDIRGVKWAREAHPSHWMPLPDGPQS